MIAYTYLFRLSVQQDESQKTEDLAVQGINAAQWLINAWAWVLFAINTSLTVR
jgi:hypothetical protein